MTQEGSFMEPWMKWAVEIQSLAQNGLTYAKDIYDIERYQRLRDISAEMMSLKTGFSMEQVKTVFCSETGYQTPKLDTRAAIFKDGRILLVQEQNGKWALPGGWADVLESVKSNTEKEAKEEAGLTVEAERIIAIQDRNKHNLPVYAYGIWKVFVLCHILGGSFQKNSETIASAFFSLEELPPLSEDKNTKEQIEMCFRACEDKSWQTIFD